MSPASPSSKDLDPAHVDGIGLMRTEFLFQGREKLPTEEEQYQIYKRMVEWAAGRPVTIRTLDAGGDKPIAGLTQPGDINPFLGVRGVRLSLRHLDVFREQLRALARAAVAGNLKVMIPMVTVPEELDRCRALLEQAVEDLRREGREAQMPPLGMMVEVPAAALTIEDFNADFFSIGSNDLIQYVAAASRDEPQLADLARPSRAVFSLIGHVVNYADRSGRETSLCGDLAGDPGQVAALLDQGLRIFSVAPGSAGACQGRDRPLFRPCRMSTQATPAGSQDLIAAYKAILRDVLDRRPSGMRQRLAEALGKNRSFITQIANPAYQTPIPAQHVHPIIQICHFSVQERDRFLEAYHRAHPRRLLLLKERERGRRLTLMLPDLGSEQKNHKLDSLLSEFAEKVARLIEDT